jgi:hypothetical protein
MIYDLSERQSETITRMGYTIYDEIGRKQNDDGTWSKVHLEERGFKVVGKRYSKTDPSKKEEFLEWYDTVSDLEAGVLSKDQE